MKKVLTILLCAVMALALVACGGKTETTEENEIGKLLDEGYENTMSTYGEDRWAGMFEKDGSYIRVIAELSKASYNQLSELDMSDEDYAEKERAILTSLPNVQQEDLTSQIPTEEDLNQYVGKTLGDLEDAGYENMGYWGNEDDSYVFQFEGSLYSLEVGLQEGVTIDDMDNYSVNALRALTIGSVTFTGFSSLCLGQ